MVILNCPLGLKLISKLILLDLFIFIFMRISVSSCFFSRLLPLYSVLESI